MQIGMLGSFEVRVGGGVFADVPGARLRGLLIALALEPGHPTPKVRLVDWIWGEHPPADATNALHRLVSRLRKVLPEGSVEGQTDGYRLMIEPDAVDAVRFERLVTAGQVRHDDDPRRVRLLREALGLWRGAAMQDIGLPDSPAFNAAVARLEGLRLTALEDRFDAEVSLGHGAELVTELTDLVTANPLRERLVAALMRALAADDRHTEALLVYQRAREALADTLGVDPSPKLSALHVALLRGDVGLRDKMPKSSPRAKATDVAQDPSPGRDSQVDLRDIEIFLTLAEELHFGRTTERLRVSQARVTQSIKQQEDWIGGALFERTSRSVRLTPLGERLRHRLDAGYREIMAGLDEAAAAARGQIGTLTVGTFDTHHQEIATVLDLFRQRHPQCELRMREILPSDPFGGLRAGRVDIALLWLPVHEPDLTVGPQLYTEPLVLAVAADHPLANRDQVDMDDLVDYPVVDLEGAAPDYVWEAHTPSVTPAGRPIRRGIAVATLEEAFTAVGAGSVVSPIGSYAAASRQRSDITFVPITDGPIMRYAPVWRSAGETTLVRAFVQAARDALNTA